MKKITIKDLTNISSVEYLNEVYPTIYTEARFFLASNPQLKEYLNKQPRVWVDMFAAKGDFLETLQHHYEITQSIDKMREEQKNLTELETAINNNPHLVDVIQKEIEKWRSTQENK